MSQSLELLEFREAFLLFVKCCKLVLDSKHNVNKETEIYKGVEKYLALISHKKAENPENLKKFYHDLILNFFQKNKSEILEGVDNLAWLTDVTKPMQIIFNEHLSDDKLPKTTKLYVSTIYTDAKRIAKNAKEDILGSENDKKLDLNYLYCFYQMLYKLIGINKNQHEILRMILEDLEKEIGSGLRKYTKVKEINMAGGNQLFDKLFDIVGPIAQQMGGPNSQTLDKAQFMEGLSNIGDNPQLNNIINNLGGAVNNIMTKVQSGESTGMADILNTAMTEIQTIIPEGAEGNNIREGFSGIAKFVQDESGTLEQLVSSDNSNEARLEMAKKLGLNAVEKYQK